MFLLDEIAFFQIREAERRKKESYEPRQLELFEEDYFYDNSQERDKKEKPKTVIIIDL